MISRLAACVFVAASIYGCAAKTQWAHPRKSADEFYADRAECNAMSGSGSGGGQVIKHVLNEQRVARAEVHRAGTARHPRPIMQSM